jgi:membrane-associated phospholipid phosphatase
MPLRPPSSSLTPSILPAWILRFDRRAGAAINRRVTSARADSALVGVSTAANNGVVWFAAAALLAVTGPTGRRAAVRGLLSLGGASAFANLVAKPLFGGARPHADDIPGRRRLAVFPTSASFPSGHTASAIAFATGVAIESPKRGVLIFPLALTIAYSRLHVGAHWISDIAGGALIGAGMAGLSRLLVRPARRRRRGRPLAD